MKSVSTTIRTVAACALFLQAAGFHGQALAADVAKVTVNGMVCAFCAQGIEKTIAKMPQTKSVYVNLDKRIVAVEPREGQKLDMAKIREGIIDAGYDVVKTETLANTTVAAIRAELTARK
jgi:copper chaperone CopZ